MMEVGLPSDKRLEEVTSDEPLSQHSQRGHRHDRHDLQRFWDCPLTRLHFVT